MTQTTTQADALFDALSKLYQDGKINVVSETIGEMRVALSDGGNSGFGPTHTIDFKIFDRRCSTVCVSIRTKGYVLIHNGEVLRGYDSLDGVIKGIEKIIVAQ